MAKGGPLQEVSVAGRIFPVASDADTTRKLGGFTAKYEANDNGTAREIMERQTWEIGGVKLQLDDTRSDQEFLQSVVDAGVPVDCTFTYVTNLTYQGLGLPTGDLTFSGPGKLTQQ